MANHRSNIKEILLDAAELITIRDGLTRLTFDAIAKEAVVSKGGVLHHFNSKDSLIEAMVIRGVDRWRQFYLDLYNAAPVGPGRMTKALLSNGFLDPDSWTETFRRSFSVILAAVIHNPGLSGHIRAAYSEFYEYLRNDDLPAGVSEIVGSVFDGVWLNWALGFVSLDYDMLRRMHSVLESLVMRSCSDIQTEN